MSKKIRVVVWNEYVHEVECVEIAEIYPEGIHGVIRNALQTDAELEVSTATFAEPEHGLTEERLANTDVLIYWAHARHGAVEDQVVDRIHQAVLRGMGLIVLHSGHFSKIFRKVLGTNGSLTWRDIGEKERVWVIQPGHPIAQGLGEYFDIPHSEMYGEPFAIPDPDETVFISWYEGGEVFRSGCTWHRGNGKIFYFAPGHELYPIYHQKEVLQVIHNAVHWAYRPTRWENAKCPSRPQPLEPVKGK